MPYLKKRKELCLTEGPLFKKIFIFSFPLICTNLLQILYNAADMIVVGKFSPVQGGVGAIGSTTSLINLQLNLVIGISVGANVLIANAIGARDEKRTRTAVHNALWMGLVLGILSMAIGECFSKPLLLWMDADPALLDLSVKYVRIYFLGVPFMGVLNHAIAALRAKGDTKTPLYIMSVSGILNVILNIIFVAGLGMDVDGVAWATTVSTAVSCICILIHMRRLSDWCRFEFVRMKNINFTVMGQMVRIGVPSAIQSSLFSISNMFIQRSINGFGPAVVEGNSIAVNVEGIAYTAANAVTQASITFAGQTVGAKKYDRLGKLIRDIYAAAMLVGVVASAFIFVFHQSLFSLYIREGVAAKDAIMEAAVVRAYYVILPYFLLTFMDVGTGITRGLGYTTVSMVISLLGACVFRVVWIYTVFAKFTTYEVLLVSLPISWLVTGAALLASAFWMRRQYLKKGKTEGVLEN